jgi:hypothetical protein
MIIVFLKNSSYGFHATYKIYIGIMWNEITGFSADSQKKKVGKIRWMPIYIV